MSDTVITLVQTDIPGQEMHLNIIPKITSTQRSCNNLLAHSFRHHRQCLTKVSSKENCNSSKCHFISQQITQGSINRMDSMLVLHGYLIPDNDLGLPQDFMHMTIFLYPCYRSLCNWNWNLEAGVCSSSSFKQKRCNARRCNTQCNLFLRSSSSCNSIADKGLPTPSSTAERIISLFHALQSP